MRRAYLVQLLALLVTLVIAAQAHAEPAGDYIIDDQERPIRVAFPLHDRLFVGAVVRKSGPRPTGLGIDLAIKHSFGVDFPEEEIWWRFRHTFLDTEVDLASREEDEALRLRAALIKGRYLRHDESSFILIPANVDLRIPAPFDIAVEYELLEVELGLDLPGGQGAFDVMAIDVARFAVLLDFIRDPDYRHRLAIGPLTAYSVRDVSGWVHSFIPMTGGRLVYGWESATGRLAMEARVQCAVEAELFDQRLRWQGHCALGALGEWTLLAINDMPINLVLAGSAREPRQPSESRQSLIWDASMGLRWSLPGGKR